MTEQREIENEDQKINAKSSPSAFRWRKSLES
jgi:hypothetical protein